MNYYQRHLGDYARDTGWLTTYQHGVYALLLDWYYANEKPIPVDLTYRIVKARSGPERKATQEVLLAFFDLNKSPGFAHNKHADIALAKYRAKSEVNSLIAKQREDTKRARNVPRACGASAGSGAPSHKPVASNQEEAGEVCELIPLADGTEYPVTTSLLAELRAAYPRVNVTAELKKARMWCVANPSRRKTKRGAAAFLNNWMGNATQTPEPKPYVPGGGRPEAKL